MEGHDANEGGVYKKKMVFIEKDPDTSIKGEEKETRRILREESKQCNLLYNIGLLGQACGKTFAHLFYNISIFFFIFIPGQSPPLLIVSPSYIFYWFGLRLNCTTHCSKWAWAKLVYLVLTPIKLSTKEYGMVILLQNGKPKENFSAKILLAFLSQ